MANVKDAALFARLFNVSPTPAVVTRLKDHTILALNYATSELFGVAQDEAEGQSVLPYYVDAAARQRLADAVGRKGRADGVRIHVKRQGGDAFWVQASARLVTFDGEPAVLTVFTDITDQLAAEEALKTNEHRLETQSRVLTELTGRHTDRRGSFDEELQDILSAVANTLQVARVSMWRIDEDRRAIRCVSMFHRSQNRFDSGAVLAREIAPDYFDALERDRVIAAEDVLTDPRTREFKDSYLVPNGIGAMLDIPLRQEDTMTGVLCCEHVGGRREWMFDEQNFAHSSANLIAIAAADERMREIVDRLADSDARLQGILDATADAFAATDASGQIVNWNAVAERMFGWSRSEVLGRRLTDVIARPEHRESCATALKRVVAEAAVPGANGPMTLTALHRDGHEIPVVMAVTVVRQGRGEFVGVFLRNSP